MLSGDGDRRPRFAKFDRSFLSLVFAKALNKLPPVDLLDLSPNSWGDDWTTIHDHLTEKEKLFSASNDIKEDLQDPILSPLTPRPYGMEVEDPKPLRLYGKKLLSPLYLHGQFSELLRSNFSRSDEADSYFSNPTVATISDYLGKKLYLREGEYTYSAVDRNHGVFLNKKHAGTCMYCSTWKLDGHRNLMVVKAKVDSDESANDENRILSAASHESGLLSEKKFVIFEIETYSQPELP